jgi:hypothetical protein
MVSEHTTCSIVYVTSCNIQDQRGKQESTTVMLCGVDYFKKPISHILLPLFLSLFTVRIYGTQAT